MIGEPMNDPREIIVQELEKRKMQFFAAGNTIQKIPDGLSGNPTHPTTSHHSFQQNKRAKLAPALRDHVNAGRTVEEAAKAMKINCGRVKLIAKENGIVLGDNSPKI